MMNIVRDSRLASALKITLAVPLFAGVFLVVACGTPDETNAKKSASGEPSTDVAWGKADAAAAANAVTVLKLDFSQLHDRYLGVDERGQKLEEPLPDGAQLVTAIVVSVKEPSNRKGGEPTLVVFDLAQGSELKWAPAIRQIRLEHDPIQRSTFKRGDVYLFTFSKEGEWWDICRLGERPTTKASTRRIAARDHAAKRASSGIVTVCLKCEKAVLPSL